MASSPGGPDSKEAWAMGMSSAPVVRTPLLGVSGNGVPGRILTPAITVVSPRLTLAEPSALSMRPTSNFMSLKSATPRPSVLLPSFSRLTM